MNIIDGKQISQELLSGLQSRITQLSFKPLLCDVVVGDDPVSLSYVRIKQRIAEASGLAFALVHLPVEATTAEVITAIQIMERRDELSGLIVQLPLPSSVDTDEIVAAINPQIDVDLLNPQSSFSFYSGEDGLIPPTAGAIMHILDSLDLDFNDMQFAVLGQGMLVGKPVAYLLEQRGYTVDRITESTSDADTLLRKADIIISGVGKSGLLTADQVKEGVIIIDAGTSESAGSIAGDVHFESVAPKARGITPVPGGVGPVTVAKLIENVVIVAERKRSNV